MSDSRTVTGSAVEVELTFLAREIPKEILGATGKQLIDIYIPDTDGIHPRLRLRQKGDKYEITKKIPITDDDASVHEEVTIPLSLEEFEPLSLSSSKKIAKLRYNVVIGGYDAEVDVFQDELAGLVVIDFEFASDDEKLRFETPRICLADVTQENFIAGGLLAGKNYNDIKPELDRFNYVRLDG